MANFTMMCMQTETPRFMESVLIKASRKRSISQRAGIAMTPTFSAHEGPAVVFSIGLKPSPCGSLYPSLSMEKQQRVPMRQSRMLCVCACVRMRKCACVSVCVHGVM